MSKESKLPIPRKPLSFSDTARECSHFAWCGVKDAFAWPSSLITVYGSKTIQIRAMKCFVLNGFIFLGSIVVFEGLVLPGLHFLLARSALWATRSHVRTSTNSDAGTEFDALAPLTSRALNLVVGMTYNVLWVYPIYCISFILNSMWYQEIADRSYQLHVGKPATLDVSYNRILTVIADEIYRGLLFFNYLLQASLVYLFPVIGPLVSFVYLSWLAAFYCFEYKWINKGWSLERRIDYFEEHWAYFAGFGLPCTICTFFFPQFISSGIFALLFPMYILMATSANPLPHRQHQPSFARPIPVKLSIFRFAKRANLFFIRRLPSGAVRVSALGGKAGKKVS